MKLAKQHFTPLAESEEIMRNTTSWSPASVEREVSNERTMRFYPWLLVSLVTLCCLWIAACAVLGILYDKASTEVYSTQLEHLSVYQNENINPDEGFISKLVGESISLSQPKNEPNIQSKNQMEKENRNLSDIVAQLQRHIENLNDASVLLVEHNRNISEVNDFLKKELETVSENNRQLLAKNQQCMVKERWLREKTQNVTQQNTHLKTENENLLNFSRLLESQYKNQSENYKVLQEEMLNAANENVRLRAQKNLTSEDQVSQNQETEERTRKCQDNWVFFQSKCYFFSSEKRSWQDSRNQCQSYNADLVIISSAEEQSFVTNKSLSLNPSTKLWWIGMSDTEEEGKWQWVDGSPVTEDLQYWFQRTDQPGEPDDWRVINPHGEDCGQIKKDVPDNNWMDGPCSDNNIWICEERDL